MVRPVLVHQGIVVVNTCRPIRAGCASLRQGGGERDDTRAAKLRAETRRGKAVQVDISQVDPGLKALGFQPSTS